MAEDYPHNVKAGERYSVFLGIGNHMGSSTYYVARVKFGNKTDSLPNVSSGVPSSLPILYEYRAVVENDKNWEHGLNFSFSNVSVINNRCFVGSLSVNDVAYSVGKHAAWDVEKGGYPYQLFIELWIYNVASTEFEYHDRFVALQLNMPIS